MNDHITLTDDVEMNELILVHELLVRPLIRHACAEIREREAYEATMPKKETIR